MSRIRIKEGGFFLIEVLVAMAIMGTRLMTLISVFLCGCLAIGTAIYGAVTANTIAGANSVAIHYDEALASVTSSTYSVKSRQEKIS